MEPNGDPEARIRDLERPLAEQAAANELGTRDHQAPPSADMPVPPYPHGAPPPTAPYPYPQYGSPYYSPPQRVVHKRAQPTLWLIPLVVIGFIVAGIIVFAYFNVNSTTGVSPRPSPGISGGGGSVDTPGIDIPDIPDIPIPGVPELPFAPGDEVVTVGAGDTLSFGGIEQRKTVICDQGTVNISGMTNTVEIQGDCAAVSVSGMDNVVTVESAGTITASGFDNTVTYRAGTPEISTSGTGNVVEQG